MRFIFAEHDRSFQINRIREGLAEHRRRGESDPGHFQMHQAYDAILEQLADHFLGYWNKGVAVLGLGGYGRTEMSPYSDIDLLFLRQENAPEGIFRGIRSILYLLWDARVEIGHSVRTVAECVYEANRDLAVLTSLMDTRLIWGSEELFRELAIERERLIQETDPFDLYLKIETEIRNSYEKFGHTVYFVEPHVKEGPGSLRHIQLIAWLSRMLFGCGNLHDLATAGLVEEKAASEAEEGRAYLAEIRARLHFLAGHRDDRLKFEAQDILARQMGFKDTPERRGVESFMREYYRHASTLDFFGRRVLARARLFLSPKVTIGIKQLKLEDGFFMGAGGIYHESPENLTDPKDMLRAFLAVARTRCDLDTRLADLIRTRLHSVEDESIDDPEASRLFLEIFKSRGSVARAVTAMMKIGFLERFIPDFARVRFLPQHDVYHQYTVDLHTMGVLENIDGFAKPEDDREDYLVKTIFAKLEKPEILYLAGLFHDMAKGHGVGHDVRGAQIAAPILLRLGLSQDDSDDICFLIRNHLAMTHLAFKKDLHDSAMIGRFAENVMHLHRLDLLFLLTHADLRAVGPTAFNSWRRMLLEELYFRTLDVIGGDEAEGEDIADWVGQVKAVVRELVPEEHHGPRLEKFLASAGSRYFLDFYPGVIADHYLDIMSYFKDLGRESFEPGDVITRKSDHYGSPAFSAVTLITLDRPGRFFRIAGTMFANRINILSVWTHSVGDMAIGTYHVNDIPEGPVDDPDQWARFRADLTKVMSGEADVDELVAARRKNRTAFAIPVRPRFPVKVEVDNAASDRATIVEVYAHDRPGLLYDITRTLSSFGLNIALAKITTEVDQAADIFYVDDARGNKIVDFERLDQIKTILHRHLVEMEAEYFGNGEATTT